MAKITGITVSTPMAVPDWNQTNSKKADYIKNKPSAMKNPNAITFTGAATGTYDGSKPLTVNIPEGGGGGVSDWNDLTNRPFYDNEDGSVGKQLDDKYLQVLEVPETDIFREQDVAFSYFDAFSCYVSTFPTGTFVLKAGEEYKVLWGADEFPVTAKNVVLNGTEAVAIGNTFLVTGVDNGLPFAVGSDSTGGVTFFAFEETTTKVRIYKSEGYKIKPSYLPDSLYTQIDKRIEDYINEALGGDY